MNPDTFKHDKNVRVLNLPMPKGRAIAIGDVHGCLNELKSLISLLSLTKDDTVVLLGDLVDRGSDPEGVIRYVKQLAADGFNVHTILGNHDAKVIRYHYHQLKKLETPEYNIPMRHNATWVELSSDSLEYLNGCPHAVFMPNEETMEPFPLCFVHAGLSPSLFGQEANAFIRNRYFIKNAKDHRLTPVKLVKIDGIWYVPEGAKPWYEYWDGHWTVLYGHSVCFDPEIKNNTVGCDGGCCFGGTLRAWVKPMGGSSFFVEVPSEIK
jgi:diadenosine tetraphosphatase ApaH/serine/threonine PP2A family protein phosphatase